MGSKLFDAMFSHWHARAELRCAEDPTWAEIEARRRTGGPHSVLFSDDLGLGVAEWQLQQEIFDRLNPRPLWLRAAAAVDRAAGAPAAFLMAARCTLQRSRRGFSDRDLWDFDGYLASVISAGCRDLADRTHGHPPDVTFEEWLEELAAIADGFDAVTAIKRGDLGSDPNSAESAAAAAAAAAAERGWELFRHRFADLWD